MNTMSIHVSLLSHAFFSHTSPDPLLPAPSTPRPPPSPHLPVLPSLDPHSPSPPPSSSLPPPPPSNSPSPLSTFTTSISSPRRSHGKKRGGRRRSGRSKHNTPLPSFDSPSPSPTPHDPDAVHLTPTLSPDCLPPLVVAASDYSDGAACIDDQIPPDSLDNVAEISMNDLRDKSSKVLGIVNDDLEFFALRRVPSSAQTVRLLRNADGVVHVGVMVRNSELDLRSIEELVVRKDKADQEAENHRRQIAQKTHDFEEMQRKYDKLTEEVLRLRTMLSRANQLRRESEKATELLRLEFEKLVKNFLLEDSSERKQQHGEDGGELPTV